MDHDQQETYDRCGLREERERVLSSEPMPTRYSLRSLLMLAVPVAVLSLTLRWMMESGFTKIILPVLAFGASLGAVIPSVMGFMCLALGSLDKNRGYYWEWIKSCIYFGLVGSLAVVSVAFLEWWIAH